MFKLFVLQNLVALRPDNTDVCYVGPVKRMYKQTLAALSSRQGKVRINKYTRLLGRRSHSLSQHTQFLKNNMIAENDVL